MTAVTDNKKRVTIKVANPGDRWDVHVTPDGKVVLTKLEPARLRPAKVRFEKRDGFTVAVTDRPIDENAIKEALAEFP